MVNRELDCENLENIREEIKILIRSEVRMQILVELLNSPLSKKEIKNKTNLTHSAISNNLKTLADLGFIEQEDEVFKLTNLFRINFLNLINLNKSINVIEKHKDYLNKHKLFNTKLKSLSELSPLSSLVLVETDATDIHRVTHLIKDFFIGSNSIKTVFPYLHPEYGAIFEDWLERDVGVKLILPDDVSTALIDIISNYTPKISIQNRYFKVKTLNRPLNLVVLVSDKGIILGNYKKDGSFNKNAVLVSREKEAIEWGIEVFEEYELLGDDYFSLDEVVYQNEKERLEKGGN